MASRRSGLCGCCAALRPRYKNLVDHIYPQYPQDGLVKDNMEKLTWYAMTHPDKLDKIGEYLLYRLYRDVHRKRTGYVIKSMEAFDQLLVSCHANNLNLFVESFLQMIQKLLESQEPQLQLRAAVSFEVYAKIQEDTPQYHRRYDFFISKFASMCYFNHGDKSTQKELRTAGIMGLQGVVRKTDWDSLGDNIWQPVHMDKIVPALLFNMEEKVDISRKPSSPGNESSDHKEKNPSELGEVCLRELASRATAGKVTNIIKPLLSHLDHQNLWLDGDFAVRVFKLVMYSIQVQYSVIVIKMLIGHLSESICSDNVKSRIGIANVLSKIIPIAAGECIGPSVIDVVNSLLEQTTNYRKKDSHPRTFGLLNDGNDDEENQYKETLIHALGEYANHLPDYQKIESMVFILNKIPGVDRKEDLDKPRSEKEIALQHLLLKSLLKVGTKYTATHYSTTFSLYSFLVKLMRLSVSDDWEIRLTVQKIMHTLLDRKENANNVSNASLDVSFLVHTSSKVSRQDFNFWKKSGTELMLSIQENCQFSNNRLDNIEAVYTTLMLLLIEIRHDDVLVDILRTLFHIQSVCINEYEDLSTTQILQLHGLVSALMVAVSQLIPSLQNYVRTVVKCRTEGADYLLPPLFSSYQVSQKDVLSLGSQYFFEKEVVVEILKEANLEYRRLDMIAPSITRTPSIARRERDLDMSVTDINSVNVEVDSTASSPGLRRQPLGELVTFESLKMALLDSPYEEKRKKQAERHAELTEIFINNSLETLIGEMQPPTLQNKLTEILGQFPPTIPTASSTVAPVSQNAIINSYLNAFDLSANQVAQSSCPYQLPYPDLFIY